MQTPHAVAGFGVKIRGVVPGGAGGTMAPPDFDRSVNPISHCLELLE